MKKVFMVLLAVMLLLTACGKETETGTTQAAAQGANKATSDLEALEAVWALYGEEDMFPVMGGAMESAVDGQPGQYDMAYKENLQYDVLIPVELLEYVDTAATMVHMMNRNTFTSCAMTLNAGMTMEDFALAVRNGIQEQEWMCGFPDLLFVASPGDGIVVMAFGLSDTMGVFTGHFAQAWPNAQVFYDEPIGG